MMMMMTESNKTGRGEKKEEGEGKEEGGGALGSCGMFQWHASRSLTTHI